MRDPAATTEDGFLGGRLVLRQPGSGYRAGVDAVFLAAAVPALPGARVLDLGCGVGAAALCLGVRVPGLVLTGIELQPAYAALARLNAAAAGIAFDVHDADLAALPRDLAGRHFDHVMTNPPYFQRDGGTPAQDAGREAALGETIPVATWVDAAVRRMAPGGCLTLIQRIERLPEVLAALDRRVGAVEVLPLAPRAGRAPGHFILRARKGRRTPFRLLPPIVIHGRPSHDRDAEDYTPKISKVLRFAAALPWPP